MGYSIFQHKGLAGSSDGSVVTWGHQSYGGDSSSVAAQLANVETIYNNRQSFAAKKSDGSVVVWGNTYAGPEMSNVESIYSTDTVLAAKLTDATVVMWGLFFPWHNDGTYWVSCSNDMTPDNSGSTLPGPSSSVQEYSFMISWALCFAVLFQA